MHKWQKHIHREPFCLHSIDRRLRYLCQLNLSAFTPYFLQSLHEKSQSHRLRTAMVNQNDPRLHRAKCSRSNKMIIHQQITTTTEHHHFIHIIITFSVYWQYFLPFSSYLAFAFICKETLIRTERNFILIGY